MGCPDLFFPALRPVLNEVPARIGEEALYAWFESLLTAAESDPKIAELLRAVAQEANDGLVADLFQFRNIGVPLEHNWTTQRNGAAFGTDYLSRTAMGKANIFVKVPAEKTYFYQDLEARERLRRKPYVTFPAGGSPRSGLLVTHPLQRTPLLQPERAQPLLARDQEQDARDERRRLAHHPRNSSADRLAERPSSTETGRRPPSNAPPSGTTQAVIDFQCLSRSAISSARCRSSLPSRMLMSSGSARQ